jgi:hypothetical protein
LNAHQPLDIEVQQVAWSGVFVTHHGGHGFQIEDAVNLLRQIEVAIANGKGSDRTSASSAHSVSCRDVDHVMQRIAIIGAQALFLCILAGPCQQRSVEVEYTPSDSHSDKRSAEPRLYPTQGDRDGSQR